MPMGALPSRLHYRPRDQATTETVGTTRLAHTIMQRTTGQHPLLCPSRTIRGRDDYSRLSSPARRRLAMTWCLPSTGTRGHTHEAPHREAHSEAHSRRYSERWGREVAIWLLNENVSR